MFSIMEIGFLFKDNRVDPRKKCNRPLLSMKPDSFAFNMALTGCLLFGIGTSRKVEQLLKLMPWVGAKPDANLVIVMARIHEINGGHMDEIVKLKQHVDDASDLDMRDYRTSERCPSSCYETLIQSRVHQKDSTGALHVFKEMKESNVSKSPNYEFEKLVEGCGVSGEAGLMAKLLEEIKCDQRLDYGVHVWNNVIHFFCKKRMGGPHCMLPYKVDLEI